MGREEFYERELSLLDKQLERGQISKQEHLASTRELRMDMQEEEREAAFSIDQMQYDPDVDEDYEDWGGEP